MKNFYQYLAPFAPDYSGASAVLYEAGGMIVICDPGGCSGIVCGYDEPRFYGGETPLYSAALRELDTILGRDERLVTKIIHGAAQEDGLQFIALIGGPVVSVIGTDLDAAARKVESAVGVPAFAVPTTGMEFYDNGEEKAYAALLQKFLPDVLPERRETDEKITLILGATPLELPGKYSLDDLKRDVAQRYGENAVIAGCVGTVQALSAPQRIERSVVISVPGLAAAKKLKEKYAIPYEIAFPSPAEFSRVKQELSALDEKPERVLILHQQICANALRQEIANLCGRVTVAGFFAMEEQLRRENDRFLPGENELTDLIKTEDFDLIICDPFYLPAIREGGNRPGVPVISFSQPAVSGDYYL